MVSKTVQAPTSLLTDPDLTPGAKVLWLTVRQHTEATTLTNLASASGLTVATIRHGLAQLTASGWYSPKTGALEHQSIAERVSIPPGLLSDRRVGPQAKLIYGMLQTVASFQSGDGKSTFAALGERAGVSAKTARKAVHELAGTGWIEASQAYKQAPILFSLCKAEVALVDSRLKDYNYRGEEIMKEYLSLLIDCDEFEDNARPGFLVNPLTDERMELDRYYPTVAGFEFHGAQHFRTTKQFPSETKLAKQKARDLMKEALCARRGIRFVVVTLGDLNLETMQRKVGNILPLRDLRGHEDLLEYLEKVGKSCKG